MKNNKTFLTQLIIGLLLATLFVSLIAFTAANAKSFFSEPQVVAVNNKKQIFDMLSSSKIKGRNIIVFTERGQLDSLNEQHIIDYSSFPIPAKNLFENFKNLANDNDYIWLALYRGHLRKLTWISPHKKPDIKLWAKLIPLEGYPYNNLPVVSEKVILLIEPSFLRYQSAKATYNLLRHFQFDIIFFLTPEIKKEPEYLKLLKMVEKALSK